MSSCAEFKNAACVLYWFVGSDPEADVLWDHPPVCLCRRGVRREKREVSACVIARYCTVSAIGGA